MRLPYRKSIALKKRNDGPENDYLTLGAVERLKNALIDLEKNQRPATVEDLSVALAKGDLSENAEYQDAKARLSRIDGRIFSIKEKIKKARIIDESGTSSGIVRLGSIVVLEPSPGVKREYQIVGPQETNPACGKISHVSPLGSALMGQTIGEVIKFATADKNVYYKILEIK